MTAACPAGQVDTDAESTDYDSLLHREHFGHGHEARVAAGKKVRTASRSSAHWSAWQLLSICGILGAMTKA